MEWSAIEWMDLDWTGLEHDGLGGKINEGDLF